jgi:hypothetical protein
VVVEAGVSRAFAILLLAVAGNGNEPNMAKLGRLTDESGDLVAVEAGEADIEQNGVGLEGFCSVNDRWPVVDFLRRAVESLKEKAKHSRGIDVVVDD